MNDPEKIMLEASAFLRALARSDADLHRTAKGTCVRLSRELRKAALHSLPRSKGGSFQECDPLADAPEVVMAYAKDMPTQPQPATITLFPWRILTPLDDLIPIMRETTEF